MPLKSKQENSVIHNIGLNFGLPDREIENIIRSQFEVVRDAMNRGKNLEFENCQLLNFGKFFVSENKIRSYIKRHENKIRGREEESNNPGTSDSIGTEGLVE